MRRSGDRRERTFWKLLVFWAALSAALVAGGALTVWMEPDPVRVADEEIHTR